MMTIVDESTRALTKEKFTSRSAHLTSVKEHVQKIGNKKLSEILSDSQRNAKCRVNVGDIHYDFSRQHVDSQILDELFKFADERKIKQKIQKMFDGEGLNTTEKKAALHVAMRDSKSGSWFDHEGKNVSSEITDCKEKISSYVRDVRSGKIRGYSGEVIKNVCVVGIGGSYLGTEYVYESLRADLTGGKACKGRNLRFLTNVDPVDCRRALTGCEATQTLIIIISKTFTTTETMMNADIAKVWLTDKLGSADGVGHHLLAVTASKQKAIDFGIREDRIFPVFDWVGGRYSVTSAVGLLPLMLHFGVVVMSRFLRGCRMVDEHFKTAEVSKNVPILMGLIGFYNNFFLNYNSVAVVPYCQSLLRFAAHIQQLLMESNGKRVTNTNEVIQDYNACPVFFGEPGSNAQHSFFQLLHQGTQTVPVEFIGIVTNQHGIKLTCRDISCHDELMANFFAQPDALAFGKSSKEVLEELGSAAADSNDIVLHKSFPGNKPSTVLLLQKCDAFNVGALLALYEHRTIVEGFLYDINSFDQMGVELGKKLASKVSKYLIAYRNQDNETKEEMKKQFCESTQVMMDLFCSMSSKKESTETKSESDNEAEDVNILETMPLAPEIERKSSH